MIFARLRSYFLIFACSILSSTSFAMPCGEALDSNEITLPKELHMTPEGVSYLSQNPNHRRLLMSLSKIFSFLESPDTDIYEISKLLSLRASKENLESVNWNENSFFESLNMKPSESVVSNLFYLNKPSIKARIDEFTLGMLTYLTRNAPQSPLDQTISMTHYVSKEEVKKIVAFGQSRVNELLSSPKYRPALSQLLDIEEVNDIAIQIIRQQRIAEPNSIKNDLNTELINLSKKKAFDGRASKLIVKVICTILSVMRDNIVSYGIANPNLNISVTREELESGNYSFKRQEIFEIAPQYLAHKLGVKSSINDMVDALEYFYFGVPLPLPIDHLHSHLIETSKSLLLPLKNEFSTHKASKANRPAPELNIKPFVLILRDEFIPTANSKKREHRQSTDSSSETSLDLVTNIEQQIAPEDSLRAFTSYGPNRNNLNNLKPTQLYKFWFLRESSPTIQKVKLSAAAIKWINDNPDEGLQALNALHMGQARTFGQTGIKLVINRSKKYDGAIFELKFKSSFRGLMVLINGEWQVIEFVKKDRFDSSVRDLSPI